MGYKARKQDSGLPLDSVIRVVREMHGIQYQSPFTETDSRILNRQLAEEAATARAWRRVPQPISRSKHLLLSAGVVWAGITEPDGKSPASPSTLSTPLIAALGHEPGQSPELSYGASATSIEVNTDNPTKWMEGRWHRLNSLIHRGYRALGDMARRLHASEQRLRTASYGGALLVAAVVGSTFIASHNWHQGGA